MIIQWSSLICYKIKLYNFFASCVQLNNFPALHGSGCMYYVALLQLANYRLPEKFIISSFHQFHCVSTNTRLNLISSRNLQLNPYSLIYLWFCCVLLCDDKRGGIRASFVVRVRNIKRFLSVNYRQCEHICRRKSGSAKLQIPTNNVSVDDAVKLRQDTMQKAYCNDK